MKLYVPATFLRILSLCLLIAVFSSMQAPAADQLQGARPLFGGSEVEPPNDRLYEQREGPLLVRSAVPSAEETRKIFGTNLYRQNVQPVWIEVSNEGDTSLVLSPMGLDPDYYSPRETAHRSTAGSSLAERNRDFEASGIGSLVVPAGSRQSGYVFTRVDEGTKSFNVDVLGDGIGYQFTFFVPVPGLRLDHHEVSLAELYDKDERRDLDLPELLAELEALPCCVKDGKGKDDGDPLNLVLIGNPLTLYRAFLRAGWDETETINRASLWRTALSAIAGSSYRYSPVSALYVFGRPQDIALQRARGSIHLRNHLRLWLTPYTFKGEPVWIGQISRDIGVRFTARTITTHKIDPNVDETRDFLLEDLAYADAIAEFGYVDGVGAAPYEEPRRNLTGDPYFTDGQRLIMRFSEEATPVTQLRIFRPPASSNPSPME